MEDNTGRRVLNADSRGTVELKVEKIVRDSAPSTSIYWWDFMLHPWTFHCCLLCVGQGHHQRNQNGSSPRRARLSSSNSSPLVIWSSFLCQFFSFELSCSSKSDDGQSRVRGTDFFFFWANKEKRLIDSSMPDHEILWIVNWRVFACGRVSRQQQKRFLILSEE